MSYQKDVSGNTIDDLRPRMEECERDYMRYYVEKDGNHDMSVVCGLHANLIATVGALNDDDVLNKKRVK